MDFDAAAFADACLKDYQRCQMSMLRLGRGPSHSFNRGDCDPSFPLNSIRFCSLLSPKVFVHIAFVGQWRLFHVSGVCLC